MTVPAPVAAAFVLDGRILDIRPHGRGLINDTWLVTTDHGEAPQVILQRINPLAFPRPDLIMANIETLLAHVARRQRDEAGRDWDLRFPHLYPTRDGASWHRDGNGDAWRAMSFIAGTEGFHKPRDSEQAREAGRALGRFHALISDIDTARLHDVRPDFHHTPRHLERLAQSLDQAAHAQRAMPGVAACLAFVDTRRGEAGEIEAAVAAGAIRRRPVHGDPKLDNFLFDVTSGRAASLIDLDTVKPGVIHHDIADCLRSCCNRVGESPARGEQARYDLEICRALLNGYYAEAETIGAELQVEHLLAAIRLIPFELGVRFLTDHLNGNRYFRTEFPEQNLRRAETQFQLVEDIERQETAIRAIIAAASGH